MSLNVRIEQFPKYLRVIVTGNYDLQEAINRFPSVLSVCLLTGLNKVLIDYRELQGLQAATEQALYTFGIQEQYNDYLIKGGEELRIAYVANTPLTSFEPGVNIVKNSNYSWALFSDMEAACEWLGIEPI